MSDTEVAVKRGGRGLGWLIVAALALAGGVAVGLYWGGYFAAPGEPPVEAELPPVIIEAQ